MVFSILEVEKTTSQLAFTQTNLYYLENRIQDLRAQINVYFQNSFQNIVSYFGFFFLEDV